MLYWHYWRNIKSNPIKMKYYGLTLTLHYFFGVAQRLKRLPGMQETRVRSLGREDPLEKGRATHSSILVWRIPWREEPGRLQSMESQRVRHDWATPLHFTSYSHKLQCYSFETKVVLSKGKLLKKKKKKFILWNPLQMTLVKLMQNEEAQRIVQGL